MTPQAKHYLVTVSTFEGLDLHGYLITADKKYLVDTADRLFTLVLAKGLHALPVCLQTELSSGGGVPDEACIARVREVIGKIDGKAYDHLKPMTNFRISIFAMPKDHPDNRELMGLH